MALVLADLLAHQQRIKAIMDRAEPALRDPNPDIGLLEVCRGRVTAALTTYQLYKHRELFPALKSSSFILVSRAGEEIKAACLTLGGDFRAHAVKWRTQKAVDHWNEYARGALKLIERTRVQLAREEAEASRFAWLASAPSDRRKDCGELRSEPAGRQSHPC